MSLKFQKQLIARSVDGDVKAEVTKKLCTILASGDIDAIMSTVGHICVVHDRLKPPVSAPTARAARA